jgi:hypothetical protein
LRVSADRRQADGECKKHAPRQQDRAQLGQSIDQIVDRIRPPAKPFGRYRKPPPAEKRASSDCLGRALSELLVSEGLNQNKYAMPTIKRLANERNRI